MNEASNTRLFPNRPQLGDLQCHHIQRPQPHSLQLANKSVLVWHLTHSNLGEDNSHAHFSSEVVISSNGPFALLGNWDATLHLWEINSSTTDCRLAGHANDVLSEAFSVVICQIINRSHNKSIKLWNALGECKYTIGIDSDEHSE